MFGNDDAVDDGDGDGDGDDDDNDDDDDDNEENNETMPTFDCITSVSAC